MSLIILYLTNMLGYIIVASPFYLIGRIIFVKKKKRQLILKNEITLLLFAMYIIGLASQTVIPQWSMGIYSNTREFYFNVNLSNTISTMNIIPFHTIYQYFFETNTNVDYWGSVSLLNLTANTLLFLPLGFLLPLIWNKWNSFKKFLYLVLTVTISVEILQLFIGRSTDIDDVILNTFGAIMGYGIFSLLKWIIARTSFNKTPLKNF